LVVEGRDQDDGFEGQVVLLAVWNGGMRRR
jgi:hypothetical protein